MSFSTDLYDSILADVVTLTNRPDLEAEAAVALRSATTNAHLVDAFPRDSVTTQVQVPNSSNQISFDLSTLFPGMRGIRTIRPIDINLNLMPNWQNAEIDVVEMGDIYDEEYGNLRTNIAYISGNSLVVRCPISNSGYAIDWLKTPQTSRTLYDSWIAQLAPSIIINWAAALVYLTQGDEDKSQKYLTMVEKFYIPQLKSNFLMSAHR